jgi:hypothetical protein
MRKLMSSITRVVVVGTAPAVVLAVSVALSAGCKKEPPQAAVPPSPTAVKEAPLAEQPAGATGDRVLAEASPDENESPARRADTGRGRPSPSIRPASAGSRAARVEPKTDEAPSAVGREGIGAGQVAAAPQVLDDVARANVPAEEAVLDAGDPSLELAGDPGTGGGLPSAARPGILPNSRPAFAPRLPPAGVPPDPQAAPLDAPAFDEGADAPPRRVDRMRPRGAPPAPGELGGDGLGPSDPGFGAPMPPEAAAGEPAPADADPAGRLPASDPRARIVLPTQIKPNAELLLRKEDMVEVLGLTKALDVHELPGLVADNLYDAIYWGSPNGSTYYAGVQIWKPRSPIEAQRRYTQMVRSYPNAEETTAVGTNAFLGYWNDFYYLVFRMNDNANPSVVALTCNISACTSPDKLVVLASRIFDRLKTKEAVP